MKRNTERDYWVDDSKVQKWSAGKGKIRLAWTKWLGRNWIDLRIMRREDDGYIHTRHGVRITPDQLRDMLPALNEVLEHIDNTEEEERRKLPVKEKQE